MCNYNSLVTDFILFYKFLKFENCSLKKVLNDVKIAEMADQMK